MTLGEDADDMDFDARKDELYEKCEMCNQEAFNKYITYKVGIVDFNVTYENDCLKNILSKYDIDALIQKQVNSKSQNNTRKKGNNKHK